MECEHPLSVARGAGVDGMDVVYWLDDAAVHRREGPATARFSVGEALEGVSATSTHVAVWSHRAIRVLEATTGELLFSHQVEPSYALARVVAVPEGIEIYGMSNTGYPVDRFGERRRVTFDHRSEVLATAWGRIPRTFAVGTSLEGEYGLLHEGPEGTLRRDGGLLVFRADTRSGDLAPAEVVLAGSADTEVAASAVGMLAGELVLAVWAFRRWTAWRLRDGERIGGGDEAARVRAVDFANGEAVVLLEGRGPMPRSLAA